MSKFYSKTTNGFYDDAINTGTMPEDASQITDEIYLQLMEGQAAGGTISFSGDMPVLIPATVSDEKITILKAIIALENTITARRRDEAILGTDGGWLAAKREEISALRATLPVS